MNALAGAVKTMLVQHSCTAQKLVSKIQTVNLDAALSAIVVHQMFALEEKQMVIRAISILNAKANLVHFLKMLALIQLLARAESVKQKPKSNLIIGQSYPCS